VPSVALHTVGFVEVAVKVIIGLTVTVTVNVLPEQLPDVGVTVYVAVCAVFVGFVKVPLMLAAFVPEAPPVIPPVTVGADQL
jgi:H+/Cl- antiporter ClcA